MEICHHSFTKKEMDVNRQMKQSIESSSVPDIYRCDLTLTELNLEKHRGKVQRLC